MPAVDTHDPRFWAKKRPVRSSPYSVPFDRTGVKSKVNPDHLANNNKQLHKPTVDTHDPRFWAKARPFRSSPHSIPAHRVSTKSKVKPPGRSLTPDSAGSTTSTTFDQTDGPSHSVSCPIPHDQHSPELTESYVHGQLEQLKAAIAQAEPGKEGNHLDLESGLGDDIFTGLDGLVDGLDAWRNLDLDLDSLLACHGTNSADLIEATEHEADTRSAAQTEIPKSSVEAVQQPFVDSLDSGLSSVPASSVASCSTSGATPLILGDFVQGLGSDTAMGRIGLVSDFDLSWAFDIHNMVAKCSAVQTTWPIDDTSSIAFSGLLDPPSTDVPIHSLRESGQPSSLVNTSASTSFLSARTSAHMSGPHTLLNRGQVADDCQRRAPSSERRVYRGDDSSPLQLIHRTEVGAWIETTLTLVRLAESFKWRDSLPGNQRTHQKAAETLRHLLEKVTQITSTTIYYSKRYSKETISIVVKLIQDVIPFYEGDFDIILLILAEGIFQYCESAHLRRRASSAGPLEALEEIEVALAQLESPVNNVNSAIHQLRSRREALANMLRDHNLL